MKDIETMELKISKFLRYGVITAGIVMATGWMMFFKSANDPFESLKTYSSLNLIDSLQMNFILQNWGKIISYVGLTVLILLPVIRVLLSTILFIRQKEKEMALVGAIVLIGLIISFSLGMEV